MCPCRLLGLVAVAVELGERLDSGDGRGHLGVALEERLVDGFTEHAGRDYPQELTIVAATYFATTKSPKPRAGHSASIATNSIVASSELLVPVSDVPSATEAPQATSVAPSPTSSNEAV